MLSTVDTQILPTKVTNLLSKKGQIVTMRTIRDMKVRKGCVPIQKDSIFQIRVGVNYDNIQNVIDKREVGLLPAENAGLPWGEWLIFPYIITHKDSFYFRCTVLRNNVVPKIRYLRNGTEITKEDAMIDCLASEFRDNEQHDNDVFTVKVDNIISINSELI